MNVETALKELDNGKIIKSDSILFIKNIVDNQICYFWYASGLKYIKMCSISGPDQKEFTKNMLADSKLSYCTFKDYFSSLQIGKFTKSNTSNIISIFNTCIEFVNYTYPQVTLEESINRVINGEIAVLNLSSYDAFLIYHEKEKQIYFVHFNNNIDSLICDMIFSQKDIDTNNFSYILNKIESKYKDKKIITLYPSFEEYFSSSIAFRKKYGDIINIPDKINQNDLIDYSVNSKEKWKEFKNAGLLWFINTILHVFGYTIKYKVDKETGELLDVFPDRCSYRGFPQESNTRGYINVSQYMKDHAEELLKESKE